MISGNKIHVTRTAFIQMYLFQVFGSENYSSKKSVLVRVRWFESISAHQKQVERLVFKYTMIRTDILPKGEKMKFKTNKEKGNSSLGIAIAYFSTNGYTVSIPLNDTQDYDLVVEKESKFYSVQVKSTGCKTKYGNYQVALKSCGGTKGKTYKTIIDTNVDLVFIVASDMSMYLIPKSEIKNKSTINLCDSYIKYKIV